MTEEPKFVKFPKIIDIEKFDFSVLEGVSFFKVKVFQKMNGTNAQIYYDPVENIIKTGSRNRWITPEDDNFGFSKFCHDFHDKNPSFWLVPQKSRIYGEWCGPGINSGEGLEEKKLFLFDENDHTYITSGALNNEFLNKIKVVPLIDTGYVESIRGIKDFINRCMDSLLVTGSRVNEFKNTEGIVAHIEPLPPHLILHGYPEIIKVKKTFNREDSAWRKKPKSENKPDDYDYERLIQPIRLSKILSSDEKYTREYPRSLPLICKAYINDLFEEEQIAMDDPWELIKNRLSSLIFKFIKHHMENKK